MNFAKKIPAFIFALLAAAALSSCAIAPAQGTLEGEAELSETSSQSVVITPETSSESSSDSESSSSESSSVSSSESSSVSEAEPAPVVYVSTFSPEQGSYIMIRLENISAKGVTFKDFLGYDRSFVPYDGGWLAFVPVKVAAEPGEYTLSFSAGDFSYSAPVTVVKREFEQQYLTVDEETLGETLESAEANTEYNNAIAPLKKTFTPEKYWDGAFAEPLKYKYKVTTSFGTFRTFSNGSVEYHNATDMAAPGGTPVYATNSGKVLYAGFLQLTGNTVLIDHGLGVISWHYHMNSISVKAGDSVEKEQQIGTVGTTGLSTGNHLHFGITVCGINTDPMKLMGTEPRLEFWKEASAN